MKDSKNLFKRLAFVGIGLCALCCALPILGVLFGIGALTLIGGFLEIVGIIALVVAIVLFAVYFARRRNAPACDVDCACKEYQNVNVVKPEQIDRDFRQG